MKDQQQLQYINHLINVYSTLTNNFVNDARVLLYEFNDDMVSARKDLLVKGLSKVDAGLQALKKELGINSENPENPPSCM